MTTPPIPHIDPAAVLDPPGVALDLADPGAEETPGSPGLIVAAVAAGVTIDLALRRPPSLATAIAIATVAVVLLVSGRLQTRSSRWLVAGAPLFGMWAALRSSPWLVPLDLVAAAGMIGLGAALSQGGSLGTTTLRGLATHTGRFGEHLLRAPGFAVRSAAGPDMVEAVRGLTRERVRSVALGLAVAVPVVGALAALLASADAVFASLFFRGEWLANVPAHVVLVLVGALLVIALLRSSGVRQIHEPTVRALFGSTEATIVLSAVIVLYAMFAIAQVVGLAAGADQVTDSLHATKDWARSGFFQLLWVAGLTLALLLTMRSVTRLDNKQQQRRLAALSVTCVLLTLMIVAVSIQRTVFYFLEFGMTMLRLYSTIFAAWIGVVFIAFGLRAAGVAARRTWFAPVVMLSGLVLLFTLNVLNPEAYVARYNVDNGARFSYHVRYLGGLSPDVIPELVEALDDLPAHTAQRFETTLCDLDIRTGTSGLGWNRSRAQAAAALDELCAP